MSKEAKKKQQSKVGKTVKPKTVKTEKVLQETQEKTDSLKATFNYYHRWVVVDGYKEGFCPRCGGWGPVYEPNCYRRECPDCNGSGKIARPLDSGHDPAQQKAILVWPISVEKM